MNKENLFIQVILNIHMDDDIPLVFLYTLYVCKCIMWRTELNYNNIFIELKLIIILLLMLNLFLLNI